MKKFRNGIFYIVVIGGFSALMYGIVLLGAKLEQGRNVIVAESEKSQWSEFIDSLVHNF